MFAVINSYAQNPSTITLNTQQNISSPAYIRASNKITLQQGFKYSVTNGTNPLMNLSISSYPSYVGSFYYGSASGATGPMNCANAADRTTKVVGSTEGVFSVSATGAATYHLPIFVSPGTAGMEPKLSIDYNSQAGVGLLGKGFNISGLSAITRTTKSLFQEGHKGGIQLNMSDVYELDGVKLFVKSGNYGVQNSTYYLESDNFSIITAMSVQGNGPQWIEVKDKAGNTIEYGRTADSRLTGIGDNTVLSWQINKITDEFGNYMTFTYKQLPGESVISRIDYTGNASMSLSPYNSVIFDYVDAGDKNNFYIAGKEFRTTQLLKSIQINAEAQHVKKYIFDYLWEKVSCLARVIEVDANGNELYPTEFCWNDINANNPLSYRKETSIFQNDADYQGLKKVLPADLNGDGFSDLICIYQGFYKVMMNKVLANISSGIMSNKIDFTQEYTANFTPGESVFGVNVSDENMDNKHEVYLAVGNANKYRILQFSNTGATYLGPYTFITNSNFSMYAGENTPSFFSYDKADYNADGIDDVLKIDPDKISLSGTQGTISFSLELLEFARPIEFDGDGNPDFFVWKKLNNNVSYKVLSIVNGQFSQIYSGTIINTSIDKITLADFNADGKTDISYLQGLTENNFYTIYGTGTYFTAPKTIPTFITQNPNSNYFINSNDINNDGKSDVVITDDYEFLNSPANNYYSYISTGNEFSTGGSYVGNWSLYIKDQTIYSDFINRADINGDGVYDMLSINDPAVDHAITNQINSRNLAIEHINTGMYTHQTIKYMNIGTEVLWKTGNDLVQVFTKQSNTSLPSSVSNYKPSIYCVYEVWNTEGKEIEIQQTTKYRYYSALFHKNGKGFLGFERTANLDEFTKLGTENEYQLNSSYFLMLPKEVKKARFLTQNVTVTTNDYFYTAKDHFSTIQNLYEKQSFIYETSARYLKGYFLAIKNSESRDYVNSKASKATFTYDINAAGSPDLITTQYGWDANTIKIETVDNDYILNHNIYKIKTTNLLTTQAGDVFFQTRTEYQFDALGHLIKKITDVGTSKALTVTYSQFDGFGHSLTESVSASDIIPRTSYIQYEAKGRFVIKQTNPIGDFATFVYEPKFGNQVQTTNISGLVSSFQYDGLGRLIHSNLSDDTENSVTYKWEEPVNYLYGTSIHGIYSITTQNEGEAYTKEYYNGGGRLVRKETLSLNGEVIVSDTKYSTTSNTSMYPHGLILEQTEPYFLGLSTPFLITKNSYDNLQRVTTTEFIEHGAGTSTIQRFTNITYNQVSSDNNYFKAKRTSIDQAGRKITKEFNGAGQNDKVDNEVSGQVQTATYAFASCGNTKSIQLSNNQNSQVILTTMAYDEVGNQIQLFDPSAGNSSYSYNSLGQMVSQTDPSGSFVFEYDLLGRIKSKTGSASGITVYDYETSNNGKENIKKITGPASSSEFVYDQLGRQIEIIESVGSEIFNTKYGFDKYSNVISQVYPGGFTTNFQYNNLGMLTQINDKNNQLIWKVDEKNAQDDIKKYSFGNGISTSVERSILHEVKSITHGNIHKQEYYFDAITGNINERRFTNLINNNLRQEQFAYDKDQLSNEKQLDPVSKEILLENNSSFDVIGNITHKDNAGDYVYGNSSSPFQLTGLNNAANSVSLNTLTVSYTDFKKVSTINETGANKQLNFTYGTDEQRKRMDYSINGMNQYTRYYSISYDKQVSAVGTKEWNYIFAPSGLAAIYLVDETGNSQLLYALTDHIGSPVLLTNNSKQIVEQYSFDAWGRRRNPNDWSYNINSSPQLLFRGYTFHEHLDEVGLINMNGRVYDPVLARFIQPDHFVQAPDILKNFNRYSYCLNNPLTYTDPSGNIMMTTIALATGQWWALPFTIYFDYFTEAGYEMQKRNNVVAIHVDHRSGNQEGIGFDISIGIPKKYPLSYRYNYGRTYFKGSFGGRTGVETREGGEWSLNTRGGFGVTLSGTTYGGNLYSRTQTTNTLTIRKGITSFQYENDTGPIICNLPGVPVNDAESDAYRTAAVRLKFGAASTGFILHTGEGARNADGTLMEQKTGDITHLFGGNIGDANESYGIIYFGLGPVRVGGDSEKNRHIIQNEIAHDALHFKQNGKGVPWIREIGRSPRKYFQFGWGNGTNLY